MSNNFEVKTQQAEGHKVLEVEGEVDLDSSPRLLTAIEDSLKDPAPLKVDLSRVTYVDSSGVAVLIQGYKLALKKSIKYLLLDPSPQVNAVIELSQLQDFFTFEFSGGEG